MLASEPRGEGAARASTRADILAAVPPRETLPDRFLSRSQALARAWAAEPLAPGDDLPAAFFACLSRHVLRAIQAGDRAELPALFDEVERSLACDDPDAASAAATCFLEALADASHEIYVHVLPWLGPRSLAFLRAWEAGARDPFLSAEQARTRLVEVLAAACPAMTRAWSRAAIHVSARDGTTTAHGIADLYFEVARAALVADDAEAIHGVFAGLEAPLDGSARPLARAFERCFLERLRELPIELLARARPHLGPRALRYWRLRLRLGEPSFGRWDEAALIPTTTLRREHAWGWSLTLPREDGGRSVRESLRRDERVVAEDEAHVDGAGEASSRWHWAATDPAGDYTFELWLGAHRLARVPLSLA